MSEINGIVEQWWQDALPRMASPNVPEWQLRDMRRLFFLGVTCMHEAMIEMSLDQSPGAIKRSRVLVQSITDELVNFVDQDKMSDVKGHA